METTFASLTTAVKMLTLLFFWLNIFFLLRKLSVAKFLAKKCELINRIASVAQHILPQLICERTFFSNEPELFQLKFVTIVVCFDWPLCSEIIHEMFSTLSSLIMLSVDQNCFLQSLKLMLAQILLPLRSRITVTLNLLKFFIYFNNFTLGIKLIFKLGIGFLSTSKVLIIVF